MKYIFHWSVLTTLIVTLLGCSSSEIDEYRLFPDEYVSEVEYDSIYYYGYNQGCESALNISGVADMDYLKDITLDNSDTRFNEGWEDGNTACEGGNRQIMPSLLMTGQVSEKGY
ncbi:hypothetical protein [Photobacterium atrarenae]|uniref:Lipoprotein n=1 Tax=Photobacterium atrarenae TaxID=865757 RepID=A0ABY5GK88_9GAMM|nr:hypothetical protein [Photobacterium atrarenae]UTV29737.1 hypothetical protein NNL38_22265 [Photobacterium atrarenae]